MLGARLRHKLNTGGTTEYKRNSKQKETIEGSDRHVAPEDPHVPWKQRRESRSPHYN